MSRERAERARTVRMARPDRPLDEGAEPEGGAAAVLALALALAPSVGWALRRADGRVASGAEPFLPARDEGPGAHVHRFRAWLRERLDLARPTLVAYRRPALQRHAPRVLAALHALEGVLVLDLEGRFDHVAPRSSELAHHASGAPSLDAAERRWGRRPATREEADALVVLAWAIDVAG